MSKPTKPQPIQPPPRLPSKDDLALLTHLSSLLHLLHHRNKNQHRRSVWYRHLSLFRRHLSHLLTDYTTLFATPTTNLERARLRTQTPTIQARITKRLAFWQDVLVGKWQRAFSQVVADGRFSVIGLVMLGCLSGVCRVVGIVEGLEVLGQEEVERVLEEFGREAWGVADVKGGGNGGFGERVARDDVVEGERVARADEGEFVARGDEGEVVAREDGDDEGADEGVAVARDAEEASRGRDDESDDEAVGAKPIQRLSSSPPPLKKAKTKPTQRLSPSPPPKVVKTKLTSTKKRTANDTTDSKPKDAKKKRIATDNTTNSNPKEAKKKRKKGGDAIDDLFSGW